MIHAVIYYCAELFDWSKLWNHLIDLVEQERMANAQLLMYGSKLRPIHQKLRIRLAACVPVPLSIFSVTMIQRGLDPLYGDACSAKSFEVLPLVFYH